MSTVNNNETETQEWNPTNRFSQMSHYTHADMSREMQEFAESGKLQTGFTNLDLMTNLYPGLYIIGAISSLGKTTFMQQMADQIAEKGTPVIFFSLEQSTLELASKSLSRIMAKKDARNAMTSLQIRKNGNDPRVVEAVAEYDKFSRNVFVAECTFSATIDTIVDTVKEFIMQTGKKPVVIVDYLQVIQADESNTKSPKDLVDMHVRRLKRLQADNKLVLFVISSLNRQNYQTQIDYESFKESGGIEYSADVLWGLQLQCVHEDVFSSQTKVNEKRQRIREAKIANPRQIELVCLKNRFGVANYNCLFDYYPQYDYFRPVVPGLDDNALLQYASMDKDGFINIPAELVTECPFS